MAILAADIAPTISAVLAERVAEILPISPNPPISYGKIAKKLSLFFRCGKSICLATRVEASSSPKLGQVASRLPSNQKYNFT